MAWTAPRHHEQRRLDVDIGAQFTCLDAAAEYVPEHVTPWLDDRLGEPFHQPRVLDALTLQQRGRANVPRVGEVITHDAQQRDQVIAQRLARRLGSGA